VAIAAVARLGVTCRLLQALLERLLSHLAKTKAEQKAALATRRRPVKACRPRRKDTSTRSEGHPEAGATGTGRVHHDRRRRKRRRHLHGRATHPARHHRRAERRLNRCSAHGADDHRGQRHPGHEAARRHHLRVLRRIHTHARASTCRRYLCAHTEGQGWGTDAEARALTDVCERLMFNEKCSTRLRRRKPPAWREEERCHVGLQAVSRAKILADFLTFSAEKARDATFENAGDVRTVHCSTAHTTPRPRSTPVPRPRRSPGPPSCPPRTRSTHRVSRRTQPPVSDPRPRAVELRLSSDA